MRTIKEQLVAAHRSGDWESAAKLSQEKEKLKKHRRCNFCGIPIKSGVHCLMHLPQNLSMKMRRWIALSLLILTMPLLAAPSPSTVSALVYFTFPSQPSNFSHYTVYYGTQSSNYTANVVGTSTNLTVNGLGRGQTFYFNVTQSTTDGTESDYTTEAVYTAPMKPPKATSLAVQAQ